MSEGISNPADALLGEIKALRAEVDRLNRNPSGRFSVQIPTAKAGTPSDLDFAAVGSKDATPPIGYAVLDSSIGKLWIKVGATSRDASGTILATGVWKFALLS